MKVNAMSKCEHMNFKTLVKVARIVQTEGGPVTNFNAEIEIKCAECEQQFEFIGVPHGMSAYNPTVSIDNISMNAPIKPLGSGPPGRLTGYSVFINDGTLQ